MLVAAQLPSPIIALGLVSLVFASVGFAIGTGKGREIPGFFLGLFLGPLGVIVVAVMEPTSEVRLSRVHEQAAANSLPSGGRAPGGASTSSAVGFVTCPHCAESVRPEATVCRHCGRDLEPVPHSIVLSGIPMTYVDRVRRQYGSDASDVLAEIDRQFRQARFTVDMEFVDSVFLLGGAGLHVDEAVLSVRERRQIEEQAVLAQQHESERQRDERRSALEARRARTRPLRIAILVVGVAAASTGAVVLAVRQPWRVHCEHRGEGVDLHGCDLAGSDLAGADLRNANLDNADLSGANLSGSVLTGASLRYAILTETDLEESDLTGADLSGADMTLAVATDAQLRGVALHETIFSDTELDGSDLAGVDFSVAAFDPSPDVPPTTFEGSDLSETDFHGLYLNSWFRDADLTGANFEDTEMSWANFNGANVDGATFEGSTSENVTCPNGLLLDGLGDCGM